MRNQKLVVSYKLRKGYNAVLLFNVIQLKEMPQFKKMKMKDCFGNLSHKKMFYKHIYYGFE